MTTLLKPLASLRLTVVLLALAMLIIFAGTWAQVDHDIWTVQQRYFHSFFSWINFALFLPRAPLPQGNAARGIVEVLRPLGFPMPGGYCVIALLLVNLLAAHTLRFKYTIKRAGILLIHGGVILLIVGEIVASIWQVEGQMPITEGQTANYTRDIREVELAVIDPSPADHDDVTVIPIQRLLKQPFLDHPSLPFQIRLEQFMPNSTAAGPEEARKFGLKPNSRATGGAGAEWYVEERPNFSGAGADASKVNAPSAYVTLVSPNGVELGTYLVSLWMQSPQDVEVDGKTYRIDLRFKRTYKPYSLTLIDFAHDKYTGTETPKNFSSRVRLRDPSRDVDREVLIWMNHPLRYAGETFYQASFDGPSTTILQVVRNPGWLIPYVSCILVGAGMLIHFGAMLLRFLGRVGTSVPSSTAGQSGVRAAPPRIAAGSGKFSTRPQQYVLKPRRAGVTVPLIVAALCAVWLVSSGRPPKFENLPFDLNQFARIPISHEGRVMPLDTLARVSLRVMSGKGELRTDKGRVPAIQWLAELMGTPQHSLGAKVFRIDDPDVKAVLKLDPDEKMFAYEQLTPRWDEFWQQVQKANRVERNRRDRFQRAVMELAGHVNLFERLVQVDSLYVAPPTTPGQEWKTFAEAHQEAQSTGRTNPGAQAFATMLTALHHQQPESFNAVASDYLSYLRANLSKSTRKAAIEVAFNNFEPFVKSIYLYVLVFLLTCAAWVVTPARPTLMRTAFWVLGLTFVFHTLGLVARVYLQGRPPVTNLYSSAIFIGWAAVGFCLAIEYLFKSGIGNLAASVIAFPTLIIAHFLAGSGDTMQMLQAVLDTNIWLATHVVVITLGYAATFLAGMLGVVYVLGGITTNMLDDGARKTVARILYGIVCFAMLFSFVGTVLGGIWADQSWGRFWGWDPKENGAALIVLWNAIILHARWGGLVRERGLALLAIFGNIVTAWSWFGTNMMGVGLHSYGFMDSAIFWMGLFIASQLLLIGLGNLPRRAAAVVRA